MKETKVLKYGLLFIVGFGIGLIGSVYVKAQVVTDTLKELKPIYTKDPKITLNQLAQQTSDEYEMIMGKLNAIKEQIRQLQDR